MAEQIYRKDNMGNYVPVKLDNKPEQPDRNRIIPEESSGRKVKIITTMVFLPIGVVSHG
jgi:hypothetical protein